ncbi:hypothetical protein [Burkholderia contaminans]|uniref:hypothetical protein n=1 Tax=Burkholderia contaminans TaxID=488447 RepID=UPI003D670390
MIDWFGDYRKDGLVAQLSMRLPGDESGREQTFSVSGIRTVTSVATSIEKMTVNSGN